MDRQTLAGRNDRWGTRLAAAMAFTAALGCAVPGWAASALSGADDAPQTFGLADDRGVFFPDKQARTAPSQQLGVEIGAVPQVTPDAGDEVDVKALLAEDEESARRGSKVLRYGVGREVAVRAADGNWYDLPGGLRLWVLDVVSPGALGLRLHFSDLRLPRGASVSVYSPDTPEDDVRPLEVAAEPYAEPRRIELFEAGRAYGPEGVWTATVSGERARVEYLAPARRHGAGALPFRIDRLQHVYVDPVARTLAKAAGPCHNDVTCYSAWASVAKAVAGIGFIGDNSLFCTGQLLNASNSDKTPYWLTANHCLSSNFEAQSAEIFWLYQTSTCGGSPPSLTSVPRSKVATLLSTGTASDYTLLMIEGTLPSGLFWAGWTSSAVADGTASTAIHHPSGDYKRISFGSKASNPTCGGTNSNHVRVNWTDGPTEPGSSGSGIFRNDTKQLYGQLHCGPSACGSETNDSYGAFSATYPNISSYLAGGSDDGSENNDTCSTARTVTTGTLSGRIVKSTDSDWYKISVPALQKLTVTLSFTHANGDVDTRLYSVCGGSAVASSTGTGNSETLTVSNSSTSSVTYSWQVYLFSDTRNSYSMTVSLSIL